MIAVSALYIYPIKSCRGIQVQGFRLDALGPELDRRFMVVDSHGKFTTQRTAPRLALVTTTLEAPGMEKLKLPLALRDDAKVVEAEVWRHRGPAIDAGDEAAEWFSECLGKPSRLVRFPPAKLRRVNPAYAPEEAHVAFSDGYPELLLSEASVADLSQRAGVALSVDRFRPNIVVAGTAPYDEDTWQRIEIGDVPFDVVKPCERCVITTIDQSTGNAGKEPLATLAKYRKRGNDVVFGQNCIHRGTGTIRVGDAVRVVNAQPA
jgi:uncharacterized protein